MSTLNIQERNLPISEQDFYLVGKHDDHGFWTSAEVKTLQEAYEVTNELQREHPERQWSIMKRTVEKTIVAQTIV